MGQDTCTKLGFHRAATGERAGARAVLDAWMRLVPRASLIVLALACGCGEDPARPAPEGGPVRFDQPALGQRSLYLFFSCDHYGSPAQATQTYAPDTLQLLVVRREGDEFRLEESLTPGSASRHGATNVTDPESTYTYTLRVAGDSLRVQEHTRSRIFSTWRGIKSTYPLVPIAGPETHFAGWQPELPYHESLVTASVRDHTQQGQHYERLNLVMDNRGMQVDGPGCFFAYAQEQGLVRWAFYSWWTRAGHGWDLLPP